VIKRTNNQVQKFCSRPRTENEISQLVCDVLWHLRLVIERIGGRTRARTWDPLIKSQLLYQLSYAP
jgi:hypothetical protein